MLGSDLISKYLRTISSFFSSYVINSKREVAEAFGVGRKTDKTKAGLYLSGTLMMNLNFYYGESRHEAVIKHYIYSVSEVHVHYCLLLLYSGTESYIDNKVTNSWSLLRIVIA